MLGHKMQEEGDGIKEKRLMRCTVYEKAKERKPSEFSHK